MMGKLNALNEGAVALADKVDKARVTSRRCAAACSGCWRTPWAASCSRARTSSRSCRSTTAWCSRRASRRRTSPSSGPARAPRSSSRAYDFSIYGGLEAKVENISPDTVVDERGNAYYLVRVRTTKPGFGEKLPIIPGMTAEVDVLTGSKSGAVATCSSRC